MCTGETSLQFMYDSFRSLENTVVFGQEVHLRHGTPWDRIGMGRRVFDIGVHDILSFYFLEWVCHDVMVRAPLPWMLLQDSSVIDLVVQIHIVLEARA